MKDPLNTLDPLKPALAAVLFHFLLMAGYVLALGGDPAILVCVHEQRLGHPPYELLHTSYRTGYDGQYYYAIARDPWHFRIEGFDYPGARRLRILYPALCWLLSGSNPDLLIPVMPLVNLLAIGSMTWMGALLARRRGLSPWWALLLPLAVNVGMPALRDLTDVLAVWALCGLLTAWVLRWPWWNVTLWAAAAAFARETNVPVVLIVLLAASVQRRLTAAGILFALLLWGTWIVVLRANYGTWPFLPTPGNFAFPLSGALDCLGPLNGLRSSAKAGVLLGYMALLLMEAGIAVYLIRRGVDLVVIGTVLYGATLLVTSGSFVYASPWSYTRAFGCLPLAAWIACSQGRSRWGLAITAIPAILPVAVVGQALAKMVVV
jgi:hypothetical protein